LTEDTPVQRHMNALNKYIKLNDAYREKILDAAGVFGVTEYMNLARLHDELEEARREFDRTWREYMISEGRLR